jgi:hypothetical protein
MTLRALTLSGVAGLLFAAVSVSSEPALAQRGGCYAPAPVVVQPAAAAAAVVVRPITARVMLMAAITVSPGPHTPRITGMANTAMAIVPASDGAGDGAAIEHDRSTFSCGMI